LLRIEECPIIPALPLPLLPTPTRHVAATPGAAERDVYSVSPQQRVGGAGVGLPRLWLEGGTSNFAAPASGHWYFSLKDANAQVRCAIVAAAKQPSQFRPKTAWAVLVAPRVGL